MTKSGGERIRTLPCKPFEVKTLQGWGFVGFHLVTHCFLSKNVGYSAFSTANMATHSGFSKDFSLFSWLQSYHLNLLSV